MVPILLYKNETICGFLTESTSCEVTEEKNGIFELSLQYPVTGSMFDNLQKDLLIKAKPNDTASVQIFRIYEITKPLNGIVTVNAEHISYALAYYPVTAVSAAETTATQAMNAILSDAASAVTFPTSFSAISDITLQKPFAVKACNVRQALGGSGGSVLDTFGGEFEFDNYNIRLHANRGEDTGVLIAYAKNMTDIKMSESIESSYTALFPYAIKDEVLTTLSPKCIEVTNTSNIAPRVLLRDFTNEFDEDEEINAANLSAHATAWLSANDINKTDVSVSVSFVHLFESPEYAQLQMLERVSLCDYVTVVHPDLKINMKLQVVKTVYNVLSEQYVKIELGSARPNLSSSIVSGFDVLERQVTQSHDLLEREYQQAILTASNLITGADGGYVHLIPTYDPQEIVISDVENYTSPSAKVWRWNKNGLGYSSNGYSGTYATAITADGAINASFITAGTLNASVIKAGRLQSINDSSYFDLSNGKIHTSNIEIVGGKIAIGSSYKTVIEAGTIEQFLNSSKTGGFSPLGTSTASYQSLYYEPGVNNATALTINWHRTSDDTFPQIALFDSIGVRIARTLEVMENFKLHGSFLTNVCPFVGLGYQLYMTNTVGGSDTPVLVMRYNGSGLAFGAQYYNTIFYGESFYPYGNVDLGASSNKWKDLYISGTANADTVSAYYANVIYNVKTAAIKTQHVDLMTGTNAYAAALQIYNGGCAVGIDTMPLRMYGTYSVFAHSVLPYLSNQYDLGNSAQRWDVVYGREGNFQTGNFSSDITCDGDIFIGGHSVKTALQKLNWGD